MKLALITFSGQGARVVARLARQWPDSRSFVHRRVRGLPEAERFDRVASLSKRLFSEFRGLVFVAPTGLVVRAIAAELRHKTRDPAVVAVDVGARWAVSLVGGHEGGANQLAFAVSGVLGAEPVVTTTTEARKRLIVGVGCRRGAGVDTIVAAVRAALASAGCSLSRVRVIASAELKAGEPGLAEAARQLGLPLRLISAAEITGSHRKFTRSQFVHDKVNLPAVAEPAALLGGRRTRFLLRKTIFHGVTVAIAREDCSPWD
jgi:cobalt-precorrin 5A hydrolase